MTDSTPLIYTTKGNIPIEGLEYKTKWDHCPDRYVKFVEIYLLDGEVVKESAHVLDLTGTICQAEVSQS